MTHPDAQRAFEEMAKSEGLEVSAKKPDGRYWSSHTHLAWTFYQAATERAAKEERERAEHLLSALKGLSKMYGDTWDLVDGGLTMMPASIPKFEKAHEQAQKAIKQYEAATAIRSSGREG
jgi:protoporphyrinogen oxidase